MLVKQIACFTSNYTQAKCVLTILKQYNSADYFSADGIIITPENAKQAKQIRNSLKKQNINFDLLG